MLNPSCVNAKCSILQAEFSVSEELATPGVKPDVKLDHPGENDMDELNEISSDEIDEASSISFTGLALTSLTTLIATCGVGLVLADKAPTPNNIARQSASLAPKINRQKQPKPVQTQRQLLPPKPIASRVEFSSMQETQELVQESLTEYHALLDYTPPAAPSPPSSPLPVRVKRLSAPLTPSLNPELNLETALEAEPTDVEVSPSIRNTGQSVPANVRPSVVPPPPVPVPPIQQFAPDSGILSSPSPVAEPVKTQELDSFVNSTGEIKQLNERNQINTTNQDETSQDLTPRLINHNSDSMLSIDQFNHQPEFTQSQPEFSSKN